MTHSANRSEYGNGWDTQKIIAFSDGYVGSKNPGPVFDPDGILFGAHKLIVDSFCNGFQQIHAPLGLHASTCNILIDVPVGMP